MKSRKNKLYQKKIFKESPDLVLPDSSPGYTVLFGVFLISLSVIALEILITRISSLVFTYNYAFMAVSLAVLGLGCGGIFSYYRWNAKKLISVSNIYSRLSFYSSLFTIFVFLFLILILRVSLFTNLFLYFVITFIPFFFAGIVLSTAFMLFAANSFKLYFFDLLGAAFGALVGIFVLDLFGGVNAVLIISIIGVLASFSFIRDRYGKRLNLRNLSFSSIAIIVILLILLLNIFSGFLGEIPIRKSELKDLYLMLNESGSKAEIIESRWSAFGRTDLVGLKDNEKVKFLFIDGAAGTPMFKFDGNIDSAYQNLDFLNMIFSGTFPFNFLGENQKDSMLIMGPGGGREIIIGLVNGIKNITGVEINKDFVEMVKDYRQYNGGVYTAFDNVNIITAEGRSYLEGSKDRFDIILIIQPFTKSSRSVEGYALTENYLLTSEAIKAYTDHLTDEGILAVVLHNTNEIMRFITSTLVVFENMGISNKEAMNHLYTVGKEINPLIVLGKKSFTERQATDIYNAMLQTSLVSPLTFIPKLGQKTVTVKMEDNSTTEINIFNEDLIAVAEGRLNLQELIEKTSYNIKPTTDNRPFFFKDERWLPKNLIPIIVITFLINLVLIIASLIQTRKDRKVKELLILVMLLGFGFMMIEISFFNKLILYLGSPIYSLAIIIGVLLVGMSIGSLAGNKLFINQERKKIIIFCSGTSILTIVFFFVLSSLSTIIISYSFIIKLLISSSFLIPIGFLMGIPFPSAIKLARNYNYTNSIPWLYGINGTISVLGSVAAISISTIFGFSTSLVIGSVCYALAAILFIFKERQIFNNIKVK